MVVVDGGTTNQGFLLELLDRPEVRTGEVDTSWLDRLHLSGEIGPVRHADVALLQAAIELADEATAADRARFYAFARRGRPQADADLARTVELRHRGHSPTGWRSRRSRLDRYRVTVDGEPIEVSEPRGSAGTSAGSRLHGRAYRTLTSIQDADLLVEVDGVPHRIARDDGGIVRNLAPAVVVSIPVAVGDEVDAGDVVAVVEAMKMEIVADRAVPRPRAAGARRRERPRRRAGAARRSSSRSTAAPPPAAGERVSFAPPAPAARRTLPRARCGASSGSCSATTSTPREVERIVADLHGACADLETCDSALAGEHRLLADVRRRARAVAPSPRRGRPRDPVAAQPAGAPQRVAALARRRGRRAPGRLRRAAARRARPLRDRRPRPHAGARGGLLPPVPLPGARADRARGGRGDPRPPARAGRAARRAPSATSFREALDRLVAATRRPRSRSSPISPARCASATSTSPSSPPPATASTPRWRRTSPRSPSDPGAPGPRASTSRRSWPARGRSLTLLTARMRDARSRRCGACSSRRWPAATTASARSRPSSPRGSAATTLLLAQLPVPGPAPPPRGGLRRARRRRRGAGAFAGHAATLPDDDLAVLDLYAEHRDAGADPRRAGRELARGARGHPVAPGAAPDRRGGRAARARARHVGHRHVHVPAVSPTVSSRTRCVRGLHPMMGHRLRAVAPARTSTLERLPSAEDIYLFHGVAHANPKDERLFALAEVRDLTPVRDEDGRVVALPELERMLVEALERIRSFQAAAPPSRRPAVEPHPALRLAGRSSCTPRRSRGRWRASLRSTPASGSSTCSSAAACASPTARCATACCASSRSSARASSSRSTTRRPSRCSRSTRARAGSSRPGAAASCTPPRSSGCSRPCAPPLGQPAGDVRRARPRRRRHARPRRPPGGDQPGEHRRRHGPQLHRALPGGDAARDPARRPDAGARLARRARVPAHHRRARPRRGAAACRVEWFALSAGAKIAMDSGTENMDWIAAVLRRIVRVHPGRRRDQRRRDRHQRRRPAVLERRGDDAHAHARHPRHDPRERDGAHRQAGARLLQAASRPRTTSASAATSASWARTARRSTGRRTSRAPAAAARLLRAHLRRARRALPAARADLRPRRPRRPPRRAPCPRLGPAARRRHLLRRSATPGARSRSTSAP